MLMLGEINWGPINGGASLVLGIVLFYIGSKATEAGKKADRIDHLEAELKRTSDDRISTQMQLIRAELQIPLTELNGLMSAMRERMGDGDEHFEKVDEKNHRLELKTQQMVSDLKSYMVENMATRTDVDELNKRLTGCQSNRNKC